jgi:hypothetical protein
LSDAPVQFEPVSAPNSLVTGNNTGKFNESDLRRQRESNSAVETGLLLTISYARNQGICQRQTGKTNSATGNFLAISGFRYLVLRPKRQDR